MTTTTVTLQGVPAVTEAVAAAPLAHVANRRGRHETGPLVSVRNLSVRFAGGPPVVAGVSFDLEPGRCLALVGESGSGKSVTSRTLLGLAGDHSEVTADQLSFCGHNLLNANARHWKEIRGKGIGLILQDALTSLDPLRTVGAEVDEPLRIHTRLGRRERRFHTGLLLRDVGVPHPTERAKQYAHELSGGLRQRSLIATALAGSPQVLIADEPTTALDVTVQAQIIELLRDLKAAGSALLLVSHDLAVVASIADEILVMNAGRVVEHGPPDRVLHHPIHPYTRQLIAAVPSSRTRGERLSSEAPADFSAL
ncbi:MAG: ABC transporter ATP-binding protein, partial [Propionibacteriaceae bacterium]|nr:ABC transporter ATP-binding protein [Propionibacteriaceae bacterium]